MKSLKCYSNPTCANNRLISIIRFASQFPDVFGNLFFISIQKFSLQHPSNTFNMTPKNFTSPAKYTLYSRGAGVAAAQGHRHARMALPAFRAHGLRWDSSSLDPDRLVCSALGTRRQVGSGLEATVLGNVRRPPPLCLPGGTA